MFSMFSFFSRMSALFAPHRFSILFRLSKFTPSTSESVANWEKELFGRTKWTIETFAGSIAVMLKPASLTFILTSVTSSEIISTTRDNNKGFSIFTISQNRETVPRYFEGFGKRPDNFQYQGDIFELVKKGATSFHCSEELWNDPLAISTSMTEKQLKESRIGWDLLLDIDSQYLDYSK